MRYRKIGYFLLSIILVCIGLYLVRNVAADNTGSEDPKAASEDTNPWERGSGEDADTWSLILVNADSPLPEGYEPQLIDVGDGHSFDSRAAGYLVDMLEDARAEGLSPIICSSYRTIEKQTELFEAQTETYVAAGLSYDDALEKAKTAVAYPGTSEHNLGLAADIVATSYQLLDDAQGETAEVIWLHENCHKYGFILRYPEDKADITGIIYEPWHFRYVGVSAATEIMENGLCLEEYLQAG